MYRAPMLLLAVGAFLGPSREVSAYDPCGGQGWKMVTPGHRIASPQQYTGSGGHVSSAMLALSRFFPNVQYWVTDDTGMQTYVCKGGPRASQEMEIGFNQKAGTYLFAVTLYNPVSFPNTPALRSVHDPILLPGHGSRIGRAVAGASALQAAARDRRWSGRRVLDAVLARVYSRTLRSKGRTFWVVSLTVRPGNEPWSFYLVFVDPSTGHVAQTMRSTSSSP